MVFAIFQKSKFRGCSPCLLAFSRATFRVLRTKSVFCTFSPLLCRLNFCCCFLRLSFVQCSIILSASSRSEARPYLCECRPYLAHCPSLDHRWNDTHGGVPKDLSLCQFIHREFARPGTESGTLIRNRSLNVWAVVHWSA
jgi:hypothetical protein